MLNNRCHYAWQPARARPNDGSASVSLDASSAQNARRARIGRRHHPRVHADPALGDSAGSYASVFLGGTSALITNLVVGLGIGSPVRSGVLDPD